jgi:uncharacterized protein YbgA (DUF1722 family)
MLGQQSATDFTERMHATVARRVEALARQDLRGYVLKAKSPSCGLLRVNLYDAAVPDAAPKPLGMGLFAQALVERFPNLPVEEEGRLHDAGLRENFIERVFAYDRLRALFDARFTVGALVAFHTAHKMQLLAHSTDGYRALGHLVGRAKALPRAELRARYEADFMAVLERPATPARQANVLTHMFGHLRKELAEPDKRELLAVMEDHRIGLAPLIVPVTLLRHHVRRLGVAYLLGQTFLEPHPKELMLRNHA